MYRGENKTWMIKDYGVVRRVSPLQSTRERGFGGSGGAPFAQDFRFQQPCSTIPVPSPQVPPRISTTIKDGGVDARAFIFMSLDLSNYLTDQKFFA
jgi:hypothetical protein